MQSLLGVLKSRYFWIGIGTVSLVILAFVVGAWMNWSMVTRLLIVIAVLIACMGGVLYEFVRASRNAQKIEQSIQMQAKGQRAGAGADKQAEIDELQERLDAAITTLKSSQLGQGRRSRNALYALPWYMFIGPPGAGKTTAIKNSGLNFPVGDDGIRGVGGTRNCDWFFSDQAILLDTAGRYMTQEEDEEEWHAFLEMLKERRKHRPINGVIVGISVEQLLASSTEDIERHANDIRRRMAELVERLEVRFPVYVVFTKCDLLQGFVEFFEALSQREREQIFGATLSDEQRDDSSPGALFEREFDLIYDSLLDLRAERLSRSMKRRHRRRVFVFPLEFASAKDSLALFIDQMFQENPYQENPEFRGFYFTSGTQEGAPIDRVIRSVSEQFDLSREGENGAEPEQNEKTYFIRDVFTETIIPDQYRVEQTSRSARRGQLVRWGTAVGAAILVGCFTLFLGQALVRSEVSLGQVETVARRASTVRWDGRSSVQNLEALNTLQRELGKLEQYEEDPPFLRWGLYRGGAVLSPARTLFYEKVRPLVRAQFQKIEQQLVEADTISGTMLQGQRLDVRERLRAYLLLSEEAQRLRDEREKAFLRRFLAGVATESTGRLVTPAFRERSGQVEAQMEQYVSGMAEGEVAAFEARSALVRDVRRMIYRKPTIGTLYSKIRQEGLNSLEPVRIGSIVRESRAASLFATDSSVPGIYTKQGWNSFVRDRIEKDAENPGTSGWVLGKNTSSLTENLQDSDEVAARLRQRYFEDYASAWKDLLRSVEYRSAGSLRETARGLNQLGNQYDSPILYLLARVSAETTFETSAAKKAKGQLQDEVETRAKSKVGARTRTDPFRSRGDEESTVHPVTRRFKGLHRLKAQKAVSGGASSNLVRSLQALGRVGTTLDGIVGTPSRATKLAAKVLEDGGTLANALKTVRNNLGQIDPSARKTLFDGPILQAWSQTLHAAQQDLNERWRRDVYSTYRKSLEGRYPFSSSQQDATLSDVERFFRPQSGVVASFESKALQPFLRGDRRRPKKWEGQGIRLSTATRQFLDATDRIREELFAGGSLQLRFELTPEIPETTQGAPSPSQVFIRLHGTSQEYRMGYQPTTTFTWPGRRGARILLTTRSGEMGPKQHDGAWAWFRLLSEAEVEPRVQNVYRVRWTFEREGRYAVTTRYDLRTESTQRLVANPSSFFRLWVPETLN